MPEVYYSGWALLWLIVYIIGGVFAVAAALDVSHAVSSNQSPKKRKLVKPLSFVISWLVLMAVGAAVLNAVTYFYSQAPGAKPIMRSGAFAESQGLKTDTPYPVVIGSRVQGSTGGGYFYGGIFSSSVSFDMRPGSAVSMSFQSGDSSYIFEVPMNKLTFKLADSAGSTVTLYLEEFAGNFGTSVVKESNCRPAIASVVLVKRCDESVVYAPYAADIRRGLAPVVNGYLDSATIELSPELYEQILGTP